MFDNFQKTTWSTSNLNSSKLSSQCLFFTKVYFFTQLWGILQIFARSFSRSFLRSNLLRQIVFCVAIFLPLFSHALTSKTSNYIQGSAPYLTFDGGRTRAVDTDSLLSITLSNGMQYTPSTNTSSPENPIVLPVAGQSFADIGMFVPTDTNSVDLSALIAPPYNYWGDYDGDSDFTATGSLRVSISSIRLRTGTRYYSRSTVLEICTAPYEVSLYSTGGTLSTRYGVPNSSTFNASYVTYYVTPNPNNEPKVCFADPAEDVFTHDGIRTSMWDPAYGFLPQSTDSYDKNFPTTGANNMSFNLRLAGNNQALSWSPVSRGGITATMTNSTAKGVRVTLTGPVATESQWNSSNPGLIAKLTLPQTFELVGRDSSGKAIVKYGFTLKQWFVNRGKAYYTYPSMESWCNKIGYRMPTVKDLTNAKRYEATGAEPSSSGDYYQHSIGAGFIAEWGNPSLYKDANFGTNKLWTNVITGNNEFNRFVVFPEDGHIHWAYIGYDITLGGLCTLP